MTEVDSREPWRVADGVIVIRPPQPGDAARLIAGRDTEWARWLAPGSEEPRPTACITYDGEVIGWVDHETGHEWLATDEVNVGYNVFADARRNGYASRAVMLLMHRMAIEGKYRTASVLIDRGNVGSLRVAARARFGGRREMGNNDYLARTVPPLAYGDTATTRYVAYVDCDLANPNAPYGEANITYSCHPEHRGLGYVSRAVRLILRFLAEHTGARRAHLVIDRENLASLRVARAVGGGDPEALTNEHGRPALRFALNVDDYALDVQ